MLLRKMTRIAEPEVATANPGGLPQPRLGARPYGLQMQMVHPLQWLAGACE